jgi:sulfotransferase
MFMPPLHFISGLPRSGSTLLASILRQNPRVSASLSSPVFSLVNGMLPRLSNANEFSIFFDDATRERLLRGLFESYYAEHNAQLIFDTNRNWTAKLPLLLTLFPEAKFICCVRSLVEIVQSFDRLFTKNPLQLSTLVNYDPDASVYTRTDTLMMASGVIGIALNGLKEAFYGPHSDRLLLISYKTLASRPQICADAIYDFIDEARFTHNSENVSYSTPEYDARLGLPGLHDVRAKVSYAPTPISLPPDIVARIGGQYFWETGNEPTAAHTLLARG